jgi:translation elongation factor EF-Ts
MEHIEEVKSAKQQGAHGQTGPKTERGKWRSKMNALKHGRYAKSTLLPFEDESAFKAHLRDIRAALMPNDYVEQQIVDEYAHALWRLQRQENRTAYERERILDKLTAPMMADMLGVSPEYCAAAPSYLLDPKKKVSLLQEKVANAAYEQYGRFMKEAKGATNFNLVWRNFPDLFKALGAYIEHLGSLKPLLPIIKRI